VRILVPLKQVTDPDNANKVRVSEDGRQLEVCSIEQKANPFDEYALEAALRLTEDGRAPRLRHGETIVVSVGPVETEVLLRAGLATGADRAYRVAANDDELDAGRVAHILARLAVRESCSLVLMGKQSVDGDSNEVGQRLAMILGWPQVTFASRIVALADGRLEVDRDVDGGVQRLRVTLPAVITIDLRIVTPDAVRSNLTDKEFQYTAGVRFAPLPAIMQSRRKPLSVLALDALGPLPKRCMRYVRYELPTTKAGGRVVSTPNELVRLLASEAKVL
jgi:electron transfer flavoprotein beta subunit